MSILSRFPTPHGAARGFFNSLLAMWRDLDAALALMFVLEGILQFLNPRVTRATFMQLARLDDRSPRIMGLVSMVGGALLLYLVK